MHLHFSVGTSYLFRKKEKFPMFNSLLFRAFVSERCLYNASCTVDNSIETGHPYRAKLDVYLNRHKWGKVKMLPFPMKIIKSQKP